MDNITNTSEKSTTKQRLTAIVIALTMVLAALPLSYAYSYASEQTGSEQEKNVTDSNAEKEKPRPMVAIDPGHQKYSDSRLEHFDPNKKGKKPRISGGCVGVASDVPEYKYTLKIAKKLRKELIKRGYSVYMTRKKNNVRISNRQRALRVNKSGAAIYIRLHCDSWGSARGVSMQYKNKTNRYVKKRVTRKNKKLSKCILKKYVKATKMKNRGMFARNDLTGSNWSKIPTTLIEMGFFSNAAEDRRMQKTSFQKRMVKGIANGVDAYFGY